MKVSNSTLSMEAYSFHRDVKITNSVSGVSSENFAGDVPGETRFRLNLGEDAVAGSKNEKTERTLLEPVPELEGEEDGNVDRKRKEILSTATGAIIGRDTTVTELQFQANQRLRQDRLLGRTREPFTLMFDSVDVYQKTSSLEFQSSGKITTEDGREIEVSLDLSIRHSETYQRIRLPDSILLDPLVLSFDDGFSTLSGGSFSFDLDADGVLDNIAALSGGSGFLSLDLNDDGLINDGSELFGPISGNGYQDLAIYDKDKNLWIDESDPIFDQLRIWMGAGSENATLVSLREAGVGAISLGQVETDFELHGDQGELFGRIARAGLFLMENGEAKSLQELDLNLDVREEVADTTSTSDIDRAVLLLRRMIADRRERLEEILFSRLPGEVRKKEKLSEQFWHWQNERKV